MKVRLFKIKSIHTQVPRGQYSGTCDELPKVGKNFIMSTREEGMLWTTPVLSYNVEFSTQTISFKTKNSEYELKLEAA